MGTSIGNRQSLLNTEKKKIASKSQQREVIKNRVQWFHKIRWFETDWEEGQ
jgi:hypothetical protein